MEIEAEEIEEEKGIMDYVHVLKRRKQSILITLFTIISLSVVIIFSLPAVFQSEASILIEQQHIPESLVKSTVVSLANERINQIHQDIMATNNLNRIIKKFSLYPKEQHELTASELALMFRENSTLKIIDADTIVNGKKVKSILSFKLSFMHKDASLAQKVANEIMGSFIDNNIKKRQKLAKDTSDFLQEEAEKFKFDIQKIETKIADYKEKYKDSLPELLVLNKSSIDTIENGINQLNLHENELNGNKVSLQRQLLVTSPIYVDPNAITTDISLNNLPALEAQQKILLDKYSTKHPDVKAIKRKIANFIDNPIVTTPEDKFSKGITNPAYLQLKNELDIVNVKLQNVVIQRQSFSENLKLLNARVAETHQVERGYHNLMRDLENNKLKYQELKAKHLDALLSQTLEDEQKAEKFSILEPPRLPIKPIKPNRTKFLFMAIIVSIGAGIGVGYAFELMDSSIHGYKTLTYLAQAEPLIVIPYIKTQIEIDKENYRRLRNKIIMFTLPVILIVVALFATHIFYMPLDILHNKLLHDFNLV